MVFVMLLLMEAEEFKLAVWNYYRLHKRSMPWRTNHSPYAILVSEFMLQQTQVKRVEPKFSEFLQVFPTIENLARAPLSEVLRIWNGLGYYRRAQYLHNTAQRILTEHGGMIPSAYMQLIALPGIGNSTAGAILAYAFNIPTVFIETNVRTAVIHHFFSHKNTVTDKEVLSMVEKTLDMLRPREWYWALMDYGSYIKSTAGNLSRKSAVYKVQPAFNGSSRQLRGEIMRRVTQGAVNLRVLEKEITDKRLNLIIDILSKEDLIVRYATYIRLP